MHYEEIRQQLPSNQKQKEENNENHLISESNFKLLKTELDNIGIEVKNANQELLNRLCDIQALQKEMHDSKALLQKPKEENILPIGKLLIEPTGDLNYGSGLVELSAGVYQITNEESTSSHASQTKYCKTVLDSEYEILNLAVKKTDQPLGLVLDFYEEHQVVFIKDIRNDMLSFFHIGDQLLQMNNKKLSSVEDLIAVMKETDLGSLLSFEVKRPKKAKHYWESKFAPRKPKKKQK